jgi:ABC-type Mn2+/Zn2+ transport system ATPase subunit
MTSSLTAPGEAAFLELNDLSVHFGQRSAIQDICATIRPAEIVSLVGPNGAGKSTILRVIAGILPPSHGVAKLRGVRISCPDPSVVYVPQRAGVDWTFPVSVLDVAMMGRFRTQPRWRPRPAADRRAALHALDQVGIADLASVQIGTLSGGQQQRVFLARAILQGGDLLLLDEPFGGVDAPTQELLLGLFGGFRARGMTILFATHDLSQAAQISDRVMLVNRQTVAFGSPSKVLTEVNLRATFGGQAVLVPAHSAAELPIVAEPHAVKPQDAR